MATLITHALLHSSITAASVPLPHLPSIDTADITVSGLSAGGFAAVQLHIAFSATFRGAGVFAGGPFFCAGDLGVVSAETRCMRTPGLIDVDALVQITRNTAASHTVDPLVGLAPSRVYLFSGSNDTVVQPGVVRKLEAYYGTFVNGVGAVKAEYSVPAEHAMVTSDYGNECSYKGEPYINNCGFDAVGAMFQHMGLLNGTVRTPRRHGNAARNVSLLQFPQAPFLPPLYTLESASMASSGLLYVPDACAATLEATGAVSNGARCSLHVALHGCEQTMEQIGQNFAQHAGYIKWAEVNGIVVLFPQVRSSPVNPKGCFDWWGYTGVDYASKLGAQMHAVHAMVARLAGL